MSELADRFHDLVSGIDYPMFIVTTSAEGEHAGCLVGFVTQASVNPPRLLVMLSKQNDTLRVASAATSLVAHFLTADNHDLATLFGEESGAWTDKFTQCAWSDGPAGTRVLAGVRGWVAGRIIERFDGGDHVGHLLEPTAAEVTGDGRPLTFQAVRDMDPGHPA
jgi:flavin reductase (DIM6/NTAB) family NADH-FMN oxidoreductase RutF